MADVTMDAVSAVVGHIYEAAYYQTHWFDAVTDLRDLFGGSRSCIVRIGIDTGLAVSTVHDPELNSPEVCAVHLRDPLSLMATSQAIGEVHDYAAIGGEAVLHASEIWQDWFRPRDMHHGLLCNLLSSADSHWMLDIHRGSSQDPFDTGHIDLLRKIVPHLLRAGQINRRLENMSALASAFSHLPFGIFVVNGHRQILQMNEAAEAMLARPDSPLELRGREIVVSEPGDMLSLQQLVVNACSSKDGAMPGTGGTVLVPSHQRRPGGTRLVLSVAPFIDAQLYGLAAERRAVIMTSEVSPQIHAGFEAHVRSLFDLTPAEARLAAGLVSGRSLKETAVAGSITVKTGRTYLERIFAKTGTRQQSELVALLKSTEPLGGRGR